MTKNLRRLGVVFAAFQLVVSSNALACASCGSGSDDPLVLWPSEKFKTYVGVSTTGGFEAVGADGQRGRDAGPTSRDSLVVAVGKALREDLFTTITMNGLQTRNQKSSLRSVGDPMLAVRWSWLMPDFTEPALPQIQLMASYKFAHAKALQETQRLDLLDAFSTGLPETKWGVDVFWGMSPVKGGFAIAALFPEERRLGPSVVFPGNGLRLTGTLGLALDQRSKILVGGVQERREKRRDNGVRIDDSEVSSTSVFLTGDWGFAENQMLRVSLTDKGHWGENRNTIASRSVNIAWLSTWK